MNPMALPERLKIYREIEEIRQRPIFTYVTNSRQNAEGGMAPDALPEIIDQILLLPKGAKQADILVVSNGGDPTVAWRMISLLRERVESVGVLVPQSAFSAATLIALGADEIVMHTCGNLGPVDPQITVQRPRPGTNDKEIIRFGSEDLAGFLRFVRESVGLSDQEYLKSAFELFCKEAGAVPIGVATRAAQLSLSMGEKLLRMHMKDAEGQKARAIAEALNTKFFYHGYPVGRKEAKEIGLKVIEPEERLEKLIWDVWLDLESEMKCRKPFNPMEEVAQSPVGQQLFANVPQVTIPSGLPAEIMQQVAQQILSQISLVNLSPVDYEIRQAIIESPRKASAFVTNGKIYARRDVDLKISLNNVVLGSQWRVQDLPKE